MITTEEEYLKLKYKEPFQFCCRDCGKEITTKKSGSKREQQSQILLLCKIRKNANRFCEKIL